MCPRGAHPAMGCRQVREDAWELGGHGSGGSSLQTANSIPSLSTGWHGSPEPCTRTAVPRKRAEPAIPHAHNWTGSVLVFPSSYRDWKREPPSLTLGVTQLREPSSAVPLSRPSCRLPWTPLNPFGTMIKLHSQKITLHREKALWQAYAFFSPFRIKWTTVNLPCNNGYIFT